MGIPEGRKARDIYRRDGKEARNRYRRDGKEARDRYRRDGKEAREPTTVRDSEIEALCTRDELQTDSHGDMYTSGVYRGIGSTGGKNTDNRGKS